MDKKEISQKLKETVPFFQDVNFGKYTFEDLTLMDAFFINCNLSNCSFRNCMLRQPTFRNCDLQHVDIQESCFDKALIHKCNMSHVTFQHSTFYDSYLNSSSILNSQFNNAIFDNSVIKSNNFTDCDFIHTDFLRYTTFIDSNFNRCKFENIVLPHYQIPQDSDLVGWKLLEGFKICKLLIPADAKRTGTIISRKCRAEFAKVLEITDHYDKQYRAGKSTISLPRAKCDYVVGQIVRPDGYDDSPFEECTNGIHFFLTREEVISKLYLSRNGLFLPRV